MASISAIILPMVKDSFLIGLLVVEGVAKPRKSAKVKPVRPVWPPRKSTSEVIAALSKQQLTELAKVARSLALACVMDQVSWSPHLVSSSLLLVVILLLR